MPRREARSVTGREPVGPYILLRVERGGLDAGAPGQFFMVTPPGRLLPRPMSLCLAAAGELAFLIDVVGPGTRALAALERGDRVAVFGPLGTGFRLDGPGPQGVDQVPRVSSGPLREPLLQGPPNLLAIHLTHRLPRALRRLRVINPRVADIAGQQGVPFGRDLASQAQRTTV